MESLDTNELVAFVSVALVLIGSPGPATLGLAAAGAAFGFYRSLKFLLGLIAGLSLVVSGVALGVFTAIMAVPVAAFALSIVSLIYFGYLAIKIATADVISEQSDSVSEPGFVSGLILNLSNPKAYAAFAALFSGFQLLPDEPTTSVVLQIFICFSIVTVFGPIWLFSGSILRVWLKDQKIGRRVNIIFAGMLAASVVVTLFL